MGGGLERLEGDIAFLSGRGKICIYRYTINLLYIY